MEPVEDLETLSWGGEEGGGWATADDVQLVFNHIREDQ